MNIPPSNAMNQVVATENLQILLTRILRNHGRNGVHTQKSTSRQFRALCVFATVYLGSLEMSGLVRCSKDTADHDDADRRLILFAPQFLGGQALLRLTVCNKGLLITTLGNPAAEPWHFTDKSRQITALIGYCVAMHGLHLCQGGDTGSQADFTKALHAALVREEG